ncbi:MAG: hypothetical protein IKE63_03990 [Bacilli bacterium]|nr:hypothetical protein [Bacilli bacterium]
MSPIRDDMMKSIFNEQRYLNGDIEALEEIYELQKIHLEEELVDKEKYRETIIDYDLFLNEVVDELLKYDLNNSLEYSIALSYLLDCGYLSNDRTFKHKVSNQEIIGKLGINVVLGEGCCRNISDFHRDVFNKLQLSIQPFYCFQGIGKGTNRGANHIVNLVDYKDNKYAIDLHNYCFLYHFTKPFVMESISIFNRDKLLYKPYYGIILGEIDLDTIKENIKKFEEYSKMNPISSIEYHDDIKYRTKELMRSNKNNLEKFDCKTKALKRKIASSMNE